MEGRRQPFIHALKVSHTAFVSRAVVGFHCAVPCFYQPLPHTHTHAHTQNEECLAFQKKSCSSWKLCYKYILKLEVQGHAGKDSGRECPVCP